MKKAIENATSSKNEFIFMVRGLFGDRDIKLNIRKPLTILVGENGVGKSTILNLLNALISKNIEMLREIEFEELIVVDNNKELILKFSDLMDADFLDNHKEMNYNEIDMKDIREVAHELRATPSLIRAMISHGDAERFKDKIIQARENGGNTEFSERVVRKYFSIDYASNEKLKEFIDYFGIFFQGELVYFPTYRRVEEEAFKIGKFINVENDDKNIIQFGMEDVKKVFDYVTEEIKNQTLDGVQMVMGNLLTELLGEEDFGTSQKIKWLKERRYEIEIILKRSEKRLPSSPSEILKTFDRILKKKTLTDKDQFILYFISKYLEIYEASKDKEEKINQFIKVCNSYLQDKAFDYDPNRVEINLHSSYGEKRSIDLKSLSSGEKQIVSTFAKLYLTKPQKFIVLFDEPELSLSIAWQEKLLSDIMATQKCSYMMVVTHSPFIINKEHKKNAISFGAITFKRGKRND